MNEKLDNLLCQRYPEIFVNRHAPMTETAMCWGFDCGDGWFDLIDELCKHLTHPYRRLKNSIEHHEAMSAQSDSEKKLWSEWMRGAYTVDKLEEKKKELEILREKIPVASQVKEKFGTLRFYVERASVEDYQLISVFENMSSRVCEKCGTMKDTRTYSIGWHGTFCPEHAIERYGREEVEEYLALISEET